MRPNELCQLSGVYHGKCPDGGTWAEEKIDGWRCLHISGTLNTRNGLPLRGSGHVMPVIEAMERAAGMPLFLDGEFQVDGTLKATKEHCERGWKGGNKGTLYLFDVLPFDVWRRDNSEVPLFERKRWLVDLLAAAKADPLSWEWDRRTADAVQILPDTWFFDHAHVMREARSTWAAGGEGFVLKDATAPYRRKRTDDWQKVKQEGHHLRWAA